MALEVKGVPRVFKHNNETLDDPNSEYTPEEVLKYYTIQHSNLTGAKVTGPVFENGKATYTFTTSVGTKG